MDREIVAAFVKVVELKDRSTAAHTWRVALYAKTLAESLGVSADRIDRLMQGAVLHDIGKIDIPQSILAKPGRLTDEEFEIMKQHTTLGYDRLKRMGEDDPLLLALVRSHHERLDGSGYPDGLRGEEIPLVARVFGVIDTFDAMTSIRPYRQTIGPEAARLSIEEMQAKAGLWYWPDAVEALVEQYEAGALDWIMQYYNDETFGVTALDPLPDSSGLRAASAKIVTTVGRDPTAKTQRKA